MMQASVIILEEEEEAFSGAFELPGGEQFEIPRPDGEGWVEQERHTWPQQTVECTRFDTERGLCGYEFENGSELEFENPVASEYAERAGVEKARCLHWSRWTRAVLDLGTIDGEAAMLAGKQPAGTQPVPMELRDHDGVPQGEWPEGGHPRRVIR